MDIKSFKPRQTVYIVGDARRPRDKFSAVKAEVAKVGRKYVTISGRWGERFREAHNRDMPYLIEEAEYGSPRLLFPSEDAVREYQEREELKEWVRVAAGWDKIGRYNGRKTIRPVPAQTGAGRVSTQKNNAERSDNQWQRTRSRRRRP